MEVITVPPQRVLVVTPHPDDAEGGCGGTMAKWIKEAGTEVVVVLCTDGGKGTSDREISSAELTDIRQREQQRASDLLGVKEVVFLSHPDGGLEDSMLFRSQLVREIRRHKPDLIMCIDPYRSRSHTHRDHRTSGQVALDAAFSYSWSYLHFPEQITHEGLHPHRVSEAYLWGSETPDVSVDISGFLDLKALSLLAHASQFPDPKVRSERVRQGAAEQGKAAAIPYAESFRRIRFELDSLAGVYLNS